MKIYLIVSYSFEFPLYFLFHIIAYTLVQHLKLMVAQFLFLLFLKSHKIFRTFPASILNTSIHKSLKSVPPKKYSRNFFNPLQPVDAPSKNTANIFEKNKIQKDQNNCQNMLKILKNFTKDTLQIEIATQCKK